MKRYREMEVPSPLKRAFSVEKTAMTLNVLQVLVITASHH